MADTPSLEQIGIVKIISGIAGSVVSLRFVQGTWVEKLLMTFGGAFLSYFGTSPAAYYVGLEKSEGLVGFLIGLFGMAIASKIYELIQNVNAIETAQMVVGKIFNKSSKE